MNSEEIKEIFFKSKTFSWINKQVKKDKERKFDRRWLKVDALNIFYSPEEFLDIIANDLVKRVTKTVDEDFWLFTVGYPGSGKSSLNLLIYQFVMEKLGKNPEPYIDLLFLQSDYIGRTNYHMFTTKRIGRKNPIAIVIDEAHNTFDVFTQRASSLTRDCIQRAFEIREWRIIHLLNSQLPQHLARRILFGRIQGVIYTWYEDIDPSNPIYDYYIEYVRELYGDVKESSGVIMFSALYTRKTALRLLQYLLKEQVVIEHERVLAKFLPTMITSHFFAFHLSKDLYKKYKEVKSYNNLLKAMMQTYGLTGRLSIVLMHIINHLIEEGYEYYDDRYVRLKGSVSLSFLKDTEIKQLKISDAFRMVEVGAFGQKDIRIKYVHRRIADIVEEYKELIEKRKKIYEFVTTF